ASSIRMPATRAALSCVPKCAIANSLTGTGVRLIAVSPTAMTGAPFGPVTAAVSSDTPSATAPVSSPARPDVFITAAIRTCPRSRLVTPGIHYEVMREQSGGRSASNGGHEQARYATTAVGVASAARPCRVAGPGGARRPPGVRARLRRTIRPGLRGRPAGAARPSPVRGGRAGGSARDLAHRVPVRPGPGQRRRLGADHRAPPRGRPGPIGERLLAPGTEGRGAGAGRGRRGRDRRGDAGAPAGAPVHGRADRAAARVDQARLLQRILLPGGREAARGCPRHGQDQDQGRIDQDARLHGGDLVKAVRDDLHVLTGSYVLDAVSDAEREEFERHLQFCPACDAEVRGLRETAARLALACAVNPPARMEPHVLAATYRTRQ